MADEKKLTLPSEYPKYIQTDPNVGPVLVRNEDEEKAAKDEFAALAKQAKKQADVSR